MPNNKQIIPAVMAEGIATSSDPKITAQGLLRLENVIVNQEGGLRKRAGQRIYKLDSAACRLGKNQDRPIVLGENLYKFNSDDPLDGEWVDYGHTHMTISDRSQLRSTANQHSRGGDCVELGDVIYTIDYRAIWDDTSAYDYCYYIETWNKNTKQLIDSANSDYQIRLLKTSDDTLYIFLFGDGLKPAYFLVDIADAGTIPAGGATIIDAAASPIDTGNILDVCFIEDDETSILIAYANDDDDVELIFWIPGTGTNIVVIASTTPNVFPNSLIACWQQCDNSVIVCWMDLIGPDVINAIGYDNEGEVTITQTEIDEVLEAEQILDIAGYALTATTSKIFYNVDKLIVPDGAVATVCYSNILTDTAGTGGAGTPAIFHLNVRAIFRPFVYGDLTYLLCLYTGQTSADLNRSFVLLELGDDQMVGAYLHGYTWTSQSHTHACFIDRGDGNFAFIAGRTVANDSAALCLVEFSFNIPACSMSDIGHWTELSGDIPREFDGIEIYESGFPWGPFIAAATAGAGGPPSVDEGIHGYISTYEWTDNNGHRHQSAPSSIELVDVDSNEVVTLTLPTLSLTDRTATDIQIVIWRTLADEGTYFRLTSKANNPEERSVSHEDTASDTSISSNEQLYTTGNVLADRPPSPYTISTIHQRRVFIVNHFERQWQLYYSKEVDSQNNVAFSPFLSIACDPEGGDIIGLSSQSDRLVIFKRKSIYTTHGYGLASNGSGNNYAIPYIVSEAVGCATQKTIVQTPLGIMFDSGNGIYLLDKQFRVQFVGEAIDYYYKQVTVKAAELQPDKEQVIFITDGVALVYNYRHNMWITYTDHEGRDVITTIHGTFMTNADGDEVRTEDPGTYSEDGISSLQIKIRTGWFSFAKIAGYQRIYRIILLGQNLDGHRLRVKTAYDMDPIWVDDQTFDSDDLAYYADVSSHYGDGLASGYQDKAYMLEFATSRQKCTSIMLEITDEDLP